MPKAISKEIQLKAAQMIQEGKKVKDVAKILGISIDSVYRSVKRNQGTIFMSPQADLDGFLGYDPSGVPVFKKISRYGPYVQAGSDQSARRTNIVKGINFDDVNLEIALKILTLPRTLGRDINGNEIVVHAGHRLYGPYVSCGDIKKSCNKISPFDITLEQATELLAKKAKKPQASRNQMQKIKIPDYPLRDLVKAEEYVEQVGGFDRAVELLYAYLGYKEEREARK